ncbi:type IV toxin-antitoxin system AbiEi family antitoxin domain-containing protein [Allokutzneria multivorans]|uniref:type IV toxin-antitoxin system AbiEi family antitoxin domain-containing protein n=1 Tax=Allokutzneria multivorans TaxID=1142134 RepID=UPI0031EBB46D
MTVPPALARRSNRVLRPRDAVVYAHPRAELARLAKAGVLRQVHTGYYAIAPLDRLGDTTWRPDLAAVALGIAQADYGPATVALMGTSAARHHGAIPRAIAVAVVAVPKQRPELRTDLGRLVFVKRNTDKLDLERVDTELTTGWVTTVEQTILDLAARPALGGLTPGDTAEAVRALGRRADPDLLGQLAAEQHRPAALRMALALMTDTDA